MAGNELTVQEKKTLKGMYANVCIAANMTNAVKSQANGYTMAIASVIDELYTDPEERKQALYNYNRTYFNTNTVMMCFILGLNYAMEKEKMLKHTCDEQTIHDIRSSLMGPLAGVGDSLLFNCVRVIAAGIAMGFAAQGSILAPISFALIYGGFQLIARWYMMKVGYTAGTGFIDRIFSTGLIQSVTKAASILGLGVVGAMVASSVKVNLNWTIALGGAEVVVQDLLDGILPGLLSILIVLAFVRLLNKGISATKLLIGTIVVCIVLAAVGIF
ncbi:MAG: PTS system mannose/fructose/sorbose family transporter subunit IID [Lachnospiraceae bacterium]|nr:PTS system mannose/fructose/sorbose family transporter subunit IID [Lachnospiraceae bacterium]